MTTTIIKTSGASVALPSDYDGTSDAIHAIGGGGASRSDAGYICSGAGGAEARGITGSGLAASTTYEIQIGAGGTADVSSPTDGTETWLKDAASSGTIILRAKPGLAGTGSFGVAAGGAGGTGGTGAAYGFDGGAGGTANFASDGAGGGGGGTGGPSGAGGVGQAAQTNNGGHGGTSNNGQTNYGAGGVSGGSLDGVSGTAQSLWTDGITTVGPSGGAGGGGYPTSGNGGAGGPYGSGAGGPAYIAGNGANGGPGLLVFIYTAGGGGGGFQSAWAVNSNIIIQQGSRAA